MYGRALPEIIEKHEVFCVFDWDKLHGEGPFLRSSKTSVFASCGSGRGGAFPDIRKETGCWFICVCVQTTIRFAELLGVASAQFDSRSHSILRLWSGTKRHRFWVGVGWHFVSAVSVRSAMICVDIMSDRLDCVSVLVERCFDIFSLMSLVIVARQRDQNVRLFAHSRFGC